MCRPGLERFSRNLAQWSGLTFLACPTVKNLKILKSKKNGSRHLEKSKNCDISTAVWAISIKFGIVTWFCTLDLSTVKIFLINKNQRWRRPPSWKIEKSPYYVLQGFELITVNCKSNVLTIRLLSHKLPQSHQCVTCSFSAVWLCSILYSKYLLHNLYGEFRCNFLVGWDK